MKVHSFVGIGFLALMGTILLTSNWPETTQKDAYMTVLDFYWSW